MLRAVVGGSASGAATSGGGARYGMIGPTPGAIGAVETIVLQGAFPAGSIAANSLIALEKLTTVKSGATDTCLLTVRIGPLGTLADPAIVGLTARQLMAAANRTGGFEFIVKMVSSTSALSLGNAANNASALGASNVTVTPAATAISDTGAALTYVTVSINSGGAADTITVPSGMLVYYAS